MRLLLEPIVVTIERALPRTFSWRRQRRLIGRVIEQWQWRSRWWRDPALAGERRHYYRVACSDGVFEIYRRTSSAEGDSWWLSRIFD